MVCDWEASPQATSGTSQSPSAPFTLPLVLIGPSAALSVAQPIQQQQQVEVVVMAPAPQGGPKDQADAMCSSICSERLVQTFELVSQVSQKSSAPASEIGERLLGSRRSRAIFLVTFCVTSRMQPCHCHTHLCHLFCGHTHLCHIVIVILTYATLLWSCVPMPPCHCHTHLCHLVIVILTLLWSYSPMLPCHSHTHLCHLVIVIIFLIPRPRGQAMRWRQGRSVGSER